MEFLTCISVLKANEHTKYSSQFWNHVDKLFEKVENLESVTVTFQVSEGKGKMVTSTVFRKSIFLSYMT